MGDKLLPNIISATLDCIPFIGNIKAGIELLSGQDLITQSELDDVDKALAASSLVLSGGAKLAGKLASESAKGAKILRKAETFTKEANDVCGTVSDFKRFNELYDQ